MNCEECGRKRSSYVLRYYASFDDCEEHGKPKKNHLMGREPKQTCLITTMIGDMMCSFIIRVLQWYYGDQIKEVEMGGAWRRER